MGDSIDVLRTSRQHISFHFNFMHMNFKNTLAYDNPKDSSLCNIFILKKLTQLYKIPRKLNMSYGTQKFTFLKCSTYLKNSVS